MGKPKHSDDPRGDQKGAQTHAEGQHGDKAYQARKAEINNAGRDAGDAGDGEPRAAHDPRRDGSDAELHERKIAHPALERDGGHRLFENRTQHDEAEKNSEKNRRDIDLRRHDHDSAEFQGRSGHSGHPAATPQDGVTNIHSTGQGGGNRSDADRGGHHPV